MPNFMRFCFTINNYTDVDIETIVDKVVPLCSYVLFGKEVGAEGTPHLQGFIKLKSKRTVLQTRALFGCNPHIEPAKGSDEQNKVYCKKDNDFTEYGECISSGKRNDLEAFKADVKKGVYDGKTLRESHSKVCARYGAFCQMYISDNKPKPVVEDHPLKLWQQELNIKLNRPPDDRTIIFVVDVVGNSGKSWFAKYYRRNHDQVQIMCPGKYADMALLYDDTSRVLFLDCPRSKQGDFIQYNFLEAVKNQFVQSGKYESCIKENIEKTHVVVLMNEKPNMEMLSEDRFDIIEVNTGNNCY